MKSRTALVILTALSWLGSARLCPCRSWDKEQPPPTLSAEQLAEKLKDLATSPLTGTIFYEARWYVWAAGESKNKEYMASLKAIASARSRTNWKKLSFDALYSLWQLGEPKAYFLEKALACADDPNLAAYSIQILAYDPTPEVTEKLSSVHFDRKEITLLLTPQEKDENHSKNFVQGALGSYRAVNWAAQQYLAASNPKKKLAILVPYVGSGWSPFVEEPHEPTSGLDPGAVWGRTQLFKLSQEHPALVAKSILGLRCDFPSSSQQNDAVNQAYRAYCLRYVGQDAKRKYQELRKDEKAPPKE